MTKYLVVAGAQYNLPPSLAHTATLLPTLHTGSPLSALAYTLLHWLRLISLRLFPPGLPLLLQALLLL